MFIKQFSRQIGPYLFYFSLRNNPVTEEDYFLVTVVIDGSPVEFIMDSSFMPAYKITGTAPDIARELEYELAQAILDHDL